MRINEEPKGVTTSQSSSRAARRVIRRREGSLPSILMSFCFAVVSDDTYCYEFNAVEQCVNVSSSG